MDTLQLKERKAYKEHVCSWCGGIINKGEKYEYSTVASDGNIWSWKAHLKCRQLTADLKMFEDCWDEGLTSDDFLTTIHYFLVDEIGYKEACEFSGYKAVDKAIEILEQKKIMRYKHDRKE